MIVKVCGLTQPGNISDIITMGVDLIGLNFYPPSPRYIAQPPVFKKENAKVVGVFVNEAPDVICQKVSEFSLDLVQLHGDEDEVVCREVASFVPVIKVFRLAGTLDEKSLKTYSFCEYYLFDTATPAYGGSGTKFNWKMLSDIDIPKSFFLSGGIGPGDAQDLKRINIPNFFGIDINSRFETGPGIKDTGAISRFLQELKNLSV